MKSKKLKKQTISLIAFWLNVIIALLCIILICGGCGTTKLVATIHQPKDGTQNTITISTTSTQPITTNIEPNTNLEVKTSKKLWQNQ